MAGANFYDLHGHGKRIHYYADGKGGPVGPGSYKGPILVYDDGGSSIECHGDDLRVGPPTNAGTVVPSQHRPTPVIGPGQLQTYTEFRVTGTAARVALPM